MADSDAKQQRLFGDRWIRRLGYGAAKLTGPGVWGPPPDPEAAVRLLREAVERGVDFIDTADTYGPFVSEELIRRALHPYRDVMVATKGGCLHPGPDEWSACGRPDYLRQSCEMSLRRLGIETIDLYQLHEVDPSVPFEEQIGTIDLLRREGKICHIGLSSVTVEQLDAAMRLTSVVSVQGEYNIVSRATEPILRRCETLGVTFIPFFPLADGRLASPSGPLSALADAKDCTPAQLAIAWLLQRSPMVVAIPGTASIEELRGNLAALDVTIDPATRASLDSLSEIRSDVTEITSM